MALFNAPKCPSYIRYLAGGAFQQTRGKKKLAKATTITVRLLKDQPGFGKAGSLTPVLRGRMRQLWYPQKVADYVPFTELKKIPRSEAPQRDFFFMADKPEKKKIRADITLLSPTQSIQLLESFIPPALQFSMATISPTDSTIHGSISTGDIASAIRMVASANGPRGSRVVINPENVEFLDQSTVEGDKIKAIGEYDIEVKMKGTADFVRRKVIVMRQDTQA